MKISNEHKKIGELFVACGLGRIIEIPKQVSGGLLHKMYRVSTQNMTYAVKMLNPIIMSRKGVVENISHSESAAKALGGQIPAISAIEINNSMLLNRDNQYFLIFEWQEGQSVFPPDVSGSQCKTVGNILGRIHVSGVNIPGLCRDKRGVPVYEWDQYLCSGIDKKADWVFLLQSQLDNLKKWSRLAENAFHLLSENMVISHRDLDPKNILWKGETPFVIDWEAAGFVNPYQELLEVINYWAVDAKGVLVKDKFKALYREYSSLVNCKDVNWISVIAGGYTGMLGWLEYSLKRSLGMEAISEEERQTGSEQVWKTLQRLDEYEAGEKVLLSWLTP